MLAHDLRANGHVVYSLVRNPVSEFDVKFSLQNCFHYENIFSDLGLEVLIHCAWDLSLKNQDDSRKVNVQNSIKLFNAAKKENNIKIIFISSMSAFDGCKSVYGKQKIEVEKITFEMGGLVLRPGLIWGPHCTAGMFSTLNKLVGALPIVPMIGSGRDVLYLSHVNDLSSLICKIVANIDILNSALITAASPVPVTLKKILEIVAVSVGRSPKLIPVPSLMVLWALKILEFLKIPIRIRSDSVTGLISADKNPVFSESIFCTFAEYFSLPFGLKEIVS
jgi:nucleoside-diphosphate-sugar epimerase